MLNGKHPGLAAGACMAAAICVLSACVMAPPSVSTPSGASILPTPSGASIYSTDRCYFPGSNPPREAPVWVCSKPVTGLQYQALGAAGPSGNVIVDMRIAEMNARVAMSKLFSSDVATKASQFFQGNVPEKAFRRDFVRSNVTLRGVGVHGTVSDPKDRIYVLVGVKNPSDHERNLREAVATVNRTAQATMGNEAAEYSFLRAQQDLDHRRETKDQ